MAQVALEPEGSVCVQTRAMLDAMLITVLLQVLGRARLLKQREAAFTSTVSGRLQVCHAGDRQTEDEPSAGGFGLRVIGHGLWGSSLRFDFSIMTFLTMQRMCAHACISICVFHVCVAQRACAHACSYMYTSCLCWPAHVRSCQCMCAHMCSYTYTDCYAGPEREYPCRRQYGSPSGSTLGPQNCS